MRVALQVYALGFSNGGMILQTLLCKSPYLRSTLGGVALVNTVLRKAYLEEECADAPPPAAANSSSSSSSSSQQQQRKVPLVFIHGMQDTLFPFFEGSTSATGDVLLSTCK
jgi:poly(3-hydroxybutyrate) depolymerase